MRGGYDTPLVAAQARFVDADVDLVLQDVEQLRSRIATNPLVSVAVAAHSIRAVPIDEICTLSEYAQVNKLPFHMHVCEQRRELEESMDEYGVTPIQLLAEYGVLSERFVGVHGTHLSAEEIHQLGRTNALICICRTTERDLGDGLPQSADLVNAGTRLCVGVDSHCCENAFEEVRAIELDDRSRLLQRHAALEAPALLHAATENGYFACGLPYGEDFVELRRDDLSLVGIDREHAADGIVFAATPRAVDRVTVAGKLIVEDGRVPDLAQIIADYRACIR
jgi:cytosine/adenosine deaminase-related metal-dependent hydrolase